MIGAIQTHGEILHWHPHIHVLITCGAFTPEGEFLELPEFDMERLLDAWQDAVFGLYLAEEKIEPEVVENMRSWEHSGFSVDQSVLLPAGDQAGIERLVQYMTRCPFSLSRLVKVSDTGQIVYQAEKQARARLSRSEGRWNTSGSESQLSDPPAPGFSRRVHTAHTAQGLALDSLLRLVLEQVAWGAEEGASRRIRRAIG